MKRVMKGKSVAASVVAAFMVAAQLTGCGNANIAGTETVDKDSISEDTGIESAGEVKDKKVDMEVARTIKLDKNNIQKVNDTNGDGYGEFQGWGTSLCWWANRVGYSEKLTNEAAEAFYDPVSGLGMNIGRYNIGGGDNATTKAISEEMKEESPFIHKDHIRRSDSIVPGYCKDVTKIDLNKETKEYYETNFDRADFECGFAWNYDWDADKNQMNVLIAAAKAAGSDFIGEAFSNSPPYFMTVSGCSSGNEDPSIDNLREDSYIAFACYMADVIEHWSKENVINFQSVDPMNEPDTNYWKAFSDKQEGCHFSPGESQSRILVELNKELKNKGIDIIICGTDETSIEAATLSYKALSAEAKEVLGRIDTHSYMGSNRDALRKTAEADGKNLWMSEVDGTFSIGKKSSKMSAALGFADAIRTDLNGLMPSAWIMWDAVDLHVDSNNKYDKCTRKGADRIIDEGDTFWGIAIADHDAQELLLSKKYYAYGQFSKYIRPGYCLVGSSDFTVAAYNPFDKKTVIVAINTNVDDVRWEFDLSDFDTQVNNISVIATTGEYNWKDITSESDIEISDKTFSSVIKANSITTFVIGDSK